MSEPLMSIINELKAEATAVLAQTVADLQDEIATGGGGGAIGNLDGGAPNSDYSHIYGIDGGAP